MRCTRCDRPVLPQAVGLSSRGKVIFGWCVGCLEEAGCVEIAVSQGSRSWKKASSRLDLKAGRLLPPVPSKISKHDELVEIRLRALGTFALVLAVWGLVIGSFGASMFARSPLLTSPPPSPMGNGSPSLLMAGGGATTLIGFSLWAWTAGRNAFALPKKFRTIHLAACSIFSGRARSDRETPA